MEMEIEIKKFWDLRYGSHTQAGTAQRMEVTFDNNVKWVTDTEKWKVFDRDSGLWVDITPNDMYNASLAIAETMEADKDEIENDNFRESVTKYIKSVRSLTHIKAALEFFKSKVSCCQQDFDANPQYLGLQHGKAFDLLTLQVVDCKREWMITKTLNGNVHAPISETFYKYINTLFRDEDVRNYVQEYLGSALLGFRMRHTKDKRALFLDSSAGNTGKSTLLTLLEMTLGDYYKSVDVNVLTEPIKDPNRPNPIMGDLQGCRVVGISEVAKNTMFADDNFKKLTGNDTVCCRFLYDRKPFRYKPDFRFLIVSNYLPRPQTVDDAAFRLRFRRYTFTEAITDKDDEILDKFDTQEFRDDFLSWLVDGCQRYIANGKMLDDYDGNNLSECNLPSAMKKAIGKYLGDNDNMGDFFATFYKVTNNDKDAVSLRDMYQTWVDFTNEKNVGYYKWCEMARESFVKKYALKEAKRVPVIDKTGKFSSKAGIKGIAYYAKEDELNQTNITGKSKGSFEVDAG